MKKTKQTFKKQISKFFTGGMLLAMAFLVAGVGAVEKAGAEEIKINISEDNELNSKASNTVKNSSIYITIGKSATYGEEIMRYLGKVDVSSVDKTKSIKKAVIVMDRVSMTWDEYSAEYLLYEVSEDWDSSTATWNNQPVVSSSVYSGISGVIESYGVIEFDITEMVKIWTIGVNQNKGFLIKKANEADISDSEYGSFASSNYSTSGCETRPYLQITYYAETDSSITVTAPILNERVAINEKYSFEWEHTALDNNTIKIDLYNMDNNFIVNIATISPNGIFTTVGKEWVVPANYIGSGYRIKVSSVENPDIYDWSDRFYIYNPDNTTIPAKPTNISVYQNTSSDPVYKLAFDYTTPMVVDYYCVNVYRSVVSGQLGEKVLACVGKDTKPGANTGYFPYEDSYIKSNSNGTVYYTIRAVDTAGNESINTDQYVYSWETLIEPSIEVISPNGGEEWTRGRAQDTTWSMTGIEKAKLTLLWNEADGSSSSYQIAIIDYSIDIYGNPVVKPADNKYTYDWFVPSTQALGTNYRVQVSNADKQYVTNSGVDYDVSDNYFSIVEKYTIASPTNIKVIGILNNRYNEAPQITWTSPAGIKLSRIYRSTTKGELGQLLMSKDFLYYVSSNDASYIDQNYSAQYGVDYYYTIRSVGFLSKESENTDQYHYRKDKLTDVVFPNSGEVLSIGKSYYIKWNSTGNTGKVYISLMEDRNNMLIKNKTLFSDIENNGSVLWTPDSTIKIGNRYKIRITNQDSIFYDYSDSNNYFSIVESDASSDDSTCLPDGTLLKLPDDPKIYVIRNCERYWIRTAKEFKQQGYKWENIKISTSDVLNSLPEVSEPDQSIGEGAVIRVRGGVDIYIVKYIGNKKFIRLILNPSVFNSYGHLRWEDVIEVEEETINSFIISDLVRNATTGRIYRLTANGDSGMRRHFRSIGVMQRLGYSLDAVYEINEIDENSYVQGADLE